MMKTPAGLAGVRARCRTDGQQRADRISSRALNLGENAHRQIRLLQMRHVTATIEGVQGDISRQAPRRNKRQDAVLPAVNNAHQMPDPRQITADRECLRSIGEEAGGKSRHCLRQSLIPALLDDRAQEGIGNDGRVIGQKFQPRAQAFRVAGSHDPLRESRIDFRGQSCR